MLAVQFIRRIYSRFRNLILYGIIGCCSSSLDFIVYTFLVAMTDMYYWVANSISVLIGIMTSFILNRKYNFRVTDKTMKRFFFFMAVGLAGMLMSNIILFVCIDLLFMNELISKLCSICLVVILQFVLNKLVTFRT